MAGRRTLAGVTRAAKQLGCDVAAVQAVIAVESRGSGFLADGRPRILFEAHKFSGFTDGLFDATHPHLSTPEWDASLYEGGAAEYGRLYQALQLDGEAAVLSCSWGLMQIMGFNWEACGEASLQGFMLAQHHNEDAHLGLFARFVASQGMAPYLRRRDWAGFARRYNGPGYARHDYDGRLATAYRNAGGVA